MPGMPARSKSVAHPIAGCLGVEFHPDARCAAGSKSADPVIIRSEGGDAVSHIASTAIVHRDRVHDCIPRRDIEDDIVIGIQISAKCAGEFLDRQQAQGPVFERIGGQAGKIETVGIGGAKADYFIHYTRASRVALSDIPRTV